MNNYVAYHVHTSDSLLDSCTTYKEYVDRAAELGQKAICFTEHGNIYHWFKKYEYCKEKGIKFLYGIECYLTETLDEQIRDNYHTVLIAKDRQGVVELNRLVNASTQEDHRYYKPRISFDEFLGISDHIVKISACLAGPLHQYRKKLDGGNSKNNKKRRRMFMRLANHYDYYEVQYHIGDQEEYNNFLYRLSRLTGKPLIAGTDTHSIDDYKADCRIILKYGKTEGDWGDSENKCDLTYQSFDSLKHLFKCQNALPQEVYEEAINNTNVMADSCEEFSIDCAIKYPILYEGQDESKIMQDRINTMYRQKVKDGVIDGNNKEYIENIREEMRVFKKIDMVGFMLFMSELMCWARDNNIFTSPCRGSVGGSTIAYITDIIDVDPVIRHTIFSRFANEHRKEVGDIDTDWYEEDRPKIYQYMFDRFGERKCAYILSVGTLADKAAIDTIGKALRVIDEKEGRISKYTLEYVKRIKAEWDVNKEETREKYPEIFKYYDGLVGCSVSQSMHPAGIVVAPLDLIDNYGVFYNKDNQPILCIDMDEVHECGLVKYDILGLKNVGIVSKTCSYAKLPLPRSYQINWMDQDVFASMVKSPVGIFQFESDYAFKTLSKYYANIKAKGLDFTLDDMSICNACIRPSGESYRDDLIALKDHKNPSEIIDDLLSDTHGYLVFQEQIIAFLQYICGLSGGDADEVRRGIGRKKIEVLEAAMPSILEGYCSKSDKPRDVAESEAKEFLQIIEDASSYMFGKNHATGYSMLGYLCAYYRYKYPIEFCTAFLNCSESDEDNKNGVILARQLGFEIRPPRFRHSKSEYYMDKTSNAIYKGVKSIKYMNAEVADELYSLRDEKFNTFIDLLVTLADKSINSKQLELLIKINFFEEFGNVPKLLKLYGFFQETFDRTKRQFKKQMKKSKVKEVGLTDEALRLFSHKETDKTYMQVDFYALLVDLDKYFEMPDIGVLQKVRYQQEVLGDISIIDKRFKNFACITDVDSKYSPKVKCYAIANGNTVEAKIPKQVFNRKKLEVGDIIHIDAISYKPRQALNPDTGKWQNVTGTKVLWIDRYRMANQYDEMDGGEVII